MSLHYNFVVLNREYYIPVDKVTCIEITIGSRAVTLHVGEKKYDTDTPQHLLKTVDIPYGNIPSKN